jgi:hypothetical protein
MVRKWKDYCGIKGLMVEIQAFKSSFPVVFVRSHYCGQRAREKENPEFILA